MKKIILVISMVIVSTSCSEYQTVLKSTEKGGKFLLAEKFYNEAQEEYSKKKYRRALRLFEQIVSEYRGRPQGEKISFLFADTYYQLGDYYLSSHEFERFQQSYPNSERLEEAAFKKARSYYELSPRYDLNQSDTNKGIAELQAYLNTYPEGKHVDKANDMAAELRIKLEKKDYKIAQQYHLTGENRSGNYQAAITSLNNFLANNPGSPFREDAYYYRFDSAYQLAINSFREIMEERLEEALEYCQDYKKYYSEGEYSEAIEASAEDIKSRLQNF